MIDLWKKIVLSNIGLILVKNKISFLLRKTKTSQIAESNDEKREKTY